MKRGLYVLGCFIILSLLIFANAQPSSGINETEYQQMQGTIKNLTPIDDNGKINVSGWMGFKSKAELRIEAINNWTETNAGWLKLGFGMTPEISWDFTFVLYMWLLFFTYLVMNGHIIFSFLEVWKARLLGLGFFGALLFSKVIVILGLLLKDVFFIFWNYYIVPLGILAMLVFVVASLALLVKAQSLTLKIVKLFIRDPDKKAKLDERFNRMYLKRFIEGMQLADSVVKK